MEKKDIIIIVVGLTILGFSLYRRFMKKNNAKGSSGSTTQSGSSFSSSSKDDDYEPYSKK